MAGTEHVEVAAGVFKPRADCDAQDELGAAKVAAERCELHDEIAVSMERIMEALGGGTLMIPEEIQRGMLESGSPSLDLAGLRDLRADLRSLAARHGAG
jgi:hypothetical protein